MLIFSFIFLHLDSTRVALNESAFKYSLFILCWALVEPLSTVHLQFINLLITTNVNSFFLSIYPNFLLIGRGV